MYALAATRLRSGGAAMTKFRKTDADTHTVAARGTCAPWPIRSSDTRSRPEVVAVVLVGDFA